MTTMQESVWTTLAYRSIPTFVREDRGEEQETSITIASVWGDNQTQAI